MNGKRSKLRFALVPVLGLAATLGAAMCLAGCGEEKVKEEPPAAVNDATILYDGSKITWEASKGATKYKINVNDGEKNTSTGNTSFGFKGDSCETVSVEIVATNEWGESESVTREFTQLTKIDINNDVTFSDVGEMSWDAVDGASAYELRIDTKVFTVEETLYDDFTYGKTNKIAIRPIGDDSTFSFWSADVSKIYLGTPTEVKYDGQDITWRGYTGAGSYCIIINGNEHETVPAGQGSTMSYHYSSYGADFSVAVQAKGDGKNSFDSKVSETEEYAYLKQIDTMRVDDGYVIWDAVEGAVGYDVKVNGSVKRVKETKYQLTGSEQTRISVIPVGDPNKKCFSEWSQEQTYTLLPRPGLRWDTQFAMDGAPAKSLVWNSDSRADSYAIELTKPDGSKEQSTTPNTAPAFECAYAETGVYTVRVKAVAPAGSNLCDSAYTDLFTVERLPAPTLAPTPVTSNSELLSDGFTVHFGSVNGATKYELLREGVTDKTVEGGNTTSITQTQVLSSSDNNTGERIIRYALRAVGNFKNIGSSTKVTLSSIVDSDYATTGPGKFSVTVLATPTGIDIKDYDVTWTTVSQANGYNVIVDKFGKSTKVNGAVYSLKSITVPGDYVLSVSAAGNGGSILPSMPSVTTNLTKLDRPTEIKVNTGVDEGRLTCREVANADGYIAYFNGSTEGDVINTSTWVSVNNRIQSNGCSVVLQARGNYWNSDKSKYYITSENSDTKMFSKIPTLDISDLSFNGPVLTWDNPLPNVPQIRFIVKDEQNISLTAGDIQGTSINLYDVFEEIGPGAHSFSVRTIGTEDQYLNSEWSPAISCTLLATPEVTKSETAYTWEPVTSAEKYHVFIGDEKVAEISPSAELAYAPKFLTFRQHYTVKVYAIGNGGTSDHAIIDSRPCTIEQQLQRVGKPNITAVYGSKASDPDAYKDSNGKFFVHNEGIITVTVTAPVDKATGYTLSIGKNHETVQDGVMSYNFSAASAGPYQITAKSLGGIFDENGDYWYESEEVGNITITVLSAPSVSNVNFGRDAITWSSSSTGSTYQVTVELNEGGERTVTVSTPNVTLAELNKDQETTIAIADIKCIRIRLLGNGTTTVSSAETVANRQ